MAYGLLESIDCSTQLAGHNRLALLLFRLGTRQIFGINVFKVQEVLKVPTLTHMPGAHPPVRGVLNLRGRVRSEEHTSETPVTNAHLVCRLLLEKKKQHKQERIY